MATLGETLKGFIGNLRAKKYLGVIEGGLPVSKRNWGSYDFLNANDISLYVNRAVSKRAEKVAEVEWILRDKNGKPIEGRNDLIDLLYKPNKVFNGRQFWALAQKYYDLTGEMYILVERERELFAESKITGLHLLRSDLMTPKYSATGEIEKYEYKTPSKTYEYEAKDVLYIFNPDPKAPLRGQSLLKAGIAAIQTEIEISTYHSRVLENGGKVEGVFTFKTGALTKPQLEEIKDRYQKEYAGAKKAGIPMFLGGDAEYKNTGLTPGELSYLEAKKMTLEDICILTGVPKSVLGSTDDVQYSNADTAYRIFLRETIRPLLQNLTTALDEVLFPDDLTLDFIDPTPENIEEKLKETESGIKNYYMTTNEARERHGLEPVPGGDDILVPFNLMPLGTEKAEGTKRLKSAQTHPLADPDVRKVYADMQVKRMDAREKIFKKKTEAYLDEQRDRLVERLAPSKTRVYRKAGLLDELMQITLEVKIGKELFIPVLTDLLKDAGVDAMELAGSAYAFNITSDIKSWLDKRADIFLTQINETTFATLRNQFEESFAAEEGREKLVKRIQDTYGDIKKARAQTIARTEVHNATQYGTMEGYKQAGLTIKIWVAVADEATRESHLQADGEERPINTPFSNGLMFPGDPTGSAEETINCRCVI